MSTLRQEGIFSFIGAGLINGALVYGATNKIVEVNYFLISRLKIIFLIMLITSTILFFIKVDLLYILTIISVPFGLIRQYLRNIFFTSGNFIRLNTITSIAGIIYIILVSNSSTLVHVALFFY